MSDEKYVENCIQQAMELFQKECGRLDIKRENLGDIKDTRVRVPLILQKPILVETEQANGQVSGSLKAFVPFLREELTGETSDLGTDH